MTYLNALWPTERSGGKIAAWMHKVDTLIPISTQMVALTRKVDGWTTNQIVSAVQAVGPRRYCRVIMKMEIIMRKIYFYS